VRGFLQSRPGRLELPTGVRPLRAREGVVGQSPEPAGATALAASRATGPAGLRALIPVQAFAFRRRRRRERIVSPEKAADLLRALPAARQPLWALTLYAGRRRGELMALDHAQGEAPGSASANHPPEPAAPKFQATGAPLTPSQHLPLPLTRLKWCLFRLRIREARQPLDVTEGSRGGREARRR